MKRFTQPTLALMLTSAIGLAGCSKGNDAKPDAHELTGSWKLIDRQCYCPAGPTPNETATFTATGFAFFKNGQPTSSGTYAYTMDKICGGSTLVPTLALAYPNAVTLHATYTISGSQLILDFGSPCDAPRDTYERVQ